MPTYAWQIHDTLISECKTRANLLTTKIHHAIGRITMQDSADVTGANHDTIVSKCEYVQAAEQLQQQIFACGFGEIMAVVKGL
jgi:molybdopterin synthase catalytic subunit